MSNDEVVMKVKSRIGNLHTKETYELYRKAGASFLVLSILANGVPLYFLDLNIPKFPRGKENNKTALAQSSFVNETLLEWENKGFVKRVPLSEAKVILPLSVADRWSHSRQVLKYRLVLDCSPLTSRLSYGKIKLPDLTFLRNQIRKGDFIGLIDITSFYLHFTLQEDYSDRLCFLWDFGDGRGPVCFRAIVMLFGLPHAPWVVTMVTDVLVKHFRQMHKICLNPFIDDFSHVCHDAIEEARRQFEFARKEIRRWGFVVSEGKIVMPATKNTILGFEVDTEAMVIRFDEAKWTELRFLVEDALQERVQAKYLAKIIGKFFSMGYATRVPISCFIPSAVAEVARVTEEGTWKCWFNEVVISQQMYSELLFLLHNIKRWNGVDLKKPVKLHFYNSINPVTEYAFEPYIGDASAEAAAIYSIRNPRKFAIKYFNEVMAVTSSARRELASIELLICQHSEWIEEGATIVYASDNTSINRWVNIGTCKPDVSKTLQKIFLKCEERRIDLRVTWIPRTHHLLVEADLLSRKSTDEYCLRNRDMDYIIRRYGSPFSLDVFASKFLHKAKKFYSKYPSPLSAGSDGLFQPWGDEDAWIFPPRKLLGACIERIFTEVKLRGALASFDNAEGLMRLLLFQGNHAPDFVTQVIRFPVKVRMGYNDRLSDAVHNSFSSTWHDLVVVFIDKTKVQHSLPERCFKEKGNCQVCGGNPSVTYVKTFY